MTLIITILEEARMRHFRYKNKKFEPVLTTITVPIRLDLQNNILPDKKLEITNILFTEQSELIKSYQRLKDRIHKENQGWINYSNNEQSKNKHYIVALTAKKQIVAGATLVFHKPKLSPPIEKHDREYIYYKSAQHLGINLNKYKYAELCAPIIKKEYQNSSLIARMFSLITSYAAKEKAKYITGIFDINRNQDYKATVERLGFECMTIDQHINVKNKDHQKLDIQISPIIIKL